MSGLLEGKRGLIFGLANKHSIAHGVAQQVVAAGAQVGLSYLNDRMARRALPLAQALGAAMVAPCDVAQDAELDAFFEQATEVLQGRIDFLVHSLAFARREELQGSFSDTSRDGFGQALDISVFSLVALAKRAAPLMPAGGSLLTMTYYGAEKVVPNYNVMGPAKAALEASVRYLANDLGPRGVRVNAISAGPIKTLAAAGIPGFRTMAQATEQIAPLRRSVSQTEVGDVAVFLMSDMARGITGEVLHVDAGYHILGH